MAIFLDSSLSYHTITSTGHVTYDLDMTTSLSEISSNSSTEDFFDLLNSTAPTTITTSRRVPATPINAQAHLNAILMTYPEFRLASKLNSYGYITEVVVGSLANLMALLVTLGLSHLPICNYMAALAVSDTLVLLGQCLLRWLQTINVDPRPNSTATCRLLNFLSYWSFSLSSWLLVAMSVDRFIAISFPLKSLSLCTPRRARLVVGLLVLLLALVNLHFLFVLVVERQPGIQDPICLGYQKYRHFLDEIWPWVDASVSSLVPFAFLIVFNILIIWNHRKSIVTSSSMKGITHTKISVPMVQTYRRLTITLLVVAFSFIAMTSPRVILMAIRQQVFNFKPTPTRIDYQVLARYTLASSLVNLLLYANHGINFFLYVLTGRKFRRQFINIFMNIFRICTRARGRRVSATPADSRSTETFNSSLRYSRH